MNKNYLGVDPGLANLGLAVVQYNPSYKTFNIVHIEAVATNTTRSLGARLHYIQNVLDRITSSYNVQGVACESPSYGSSSAAYSLGAVHGLLLNLAFAKSLHVVKVAPMQLKLFAAGSTNTHGATNQIKAANMKQLVRERLENDFELDFSNIAKSDPVDAAGLGIIAAAHFGKIKFKNRKKMEVLKKIKPYYNFN